MKAADIHVHQRKRKRTVKSSRKKAPKHHELLDRVVMGVAVAFPLTTIPQILKIWVEQDAAGVSAITWSLYLILTIVFLIYGIVHKVKPVIVSYALWIFVDLVVIIGAIRYA